MRKVLTTSLALAALASTAAALGQAPLPGEKEADIAAIAGVVSGDAR